MNNIVLNEKAYAEDALRNLNLGSKPVTTLNRVARYYYSNGYKKKEIPKLLEEFLIKCDPTVNIVKWQNVIDKQANSSDKYSLLNLNGIRITESEIEAIKQSKGKLSQKLLFTMVCLAKYGNARNPENNSWINLDDSEIFQLANININTKRRSLMINDLWQLGYIKYSRVVNNININVTIIDDNSKTALVITDFRNLGNQYLKYCGEKYLECSCCGLVVKQTSNAQKYCTNCSPIVNRQKTSKRYVH